MKNTYLLLLLLLLPLLSAAQEEESKFRLEFTTQSILTLGSLYEESYGVGYQVSQKLYNYAIHFSAFRNLGNRFELGLGLGYGNRDAYTICYCVFCDKAFINNLGNLSRFRSLEVPVSLRWKWSKKNNKFKPYMLLSLVNQIPVGNKIAQVVGFTGVGRKKFLLGVNLGLGCRVQLFEKWSLMVETQTEKNQNFKFEKSDFAFGKETINRWLDEWSFKFGVSRAF